MRGYMSVQLPTPLAQPSAPARWLWHVRTRGWGDLRGKRCCPTGTEHMPGAGDCLLGLLGAGSGRKDARSGTAANTVKQPWAGDSLGQSTGSLLCTSLLGAFKGDRLLLHRHFPVCPSPHTLLLARRPACLLCVPRQGSPGGQAPRRSPRSTRTRCWCCGSPQRAKPPAPTRWSTGWRVRGQ